jgi:hypothetical protein
MRRHLRYAPAVAFALLALAFVGLWVRSYTYSDGIGGPIDKYQTAGFDSCYGLIKGNLSKWPQGSLPFDRWFFASRAAAIDRDGMEEWRKFFTPLGLGLSLDIRPNGGFGFSLPHWFLAASSLALAALLAFKPITRFSVRGLLIATRLLAAVLGAVVYAV